ncbi:LysR family transcriptional regulator [Klebsiella quasipneumoniae subsp. quasipneumoniae]|uniref:LysR substrate-binding domain-containing protein n=1 Tax=Klebsiella pneumoniae complex TaxID=3390273 RepID=UPI0011128287|nr:MULTISPECIES: LysR substrate-binding domain-containing protein [Klebsiella]KAA1704720.1 LysR family transcriptional regulator [Klebsiella variicola]MDF3332687.1 LysR substrate-binding domain-containing protein [Klebsiella quasipneumoniae subsp. similipneumoniae]MEB2993083.1 LysR substrate-binding domain-containing protein [Klebsiella variicola]TNC56886.1 LysR family transcriptional regulator [Klebsiella quasipneumoniae]
MFISDEVLRIVHLVAHYQSIATAAEQLNKVPSALSYTIKKLEESLGVELFERKGRNIGLTPSGEYFIQHSKPILNDIDSLCRNTKLIHTGVEQELTVAFNNIVPKNIISEFISEFEKTFDFTQLTVNTEVYNGCWDAIYHNRADVVVGAPHSVPSSDGIISEHVGYMDWDFVVGPQHSLATHIHPLENRELRQYTAVCIRDTATNFIPLYAWHLEGQKAVFVPDLEIAISLIKRNTAIGYLPHHLARPLLNNGRLIKKSMLEHKHATQLFVAAKTDGLGEAGRWCLEYWLRPDIKFRLNG